MRRRRAVAAHTGVGQYSVSAGVALRNSWASTCGPQTSSAVGSESPSPAATSDPC